MMASAAQSTGEQYDQLHSQPEPQPEPALPDSPLAPPSPADRALYRAHRSGQSSDAICAAARITPAALTAALARVLADNERYSSEEAILSVRRAFFQHLPAADRAIDEALRATQPQLRHRIVQQRVQDPEDGGWLEQEQEVAETIDVPDHTTRLRAIDTSIKLLGVVQPREPVTQVNLNTQTNILNQGQQPGQLGPGDAHSPEAVIRMVVAERQRQLTAGGASGPIDGEIVEGEARVPEDTGEEEAEYYDEDDEDEDEDEDEEPSEQVG